MNRLIFVINCFLVICVFYSCAVKRQPKNTLFDISQDSLLSSAHVGFKVVDLDSRDVLYAFNSHQHFMPASNTKLLTMYTGLQLLGDSIPGWSIGTDAHTLYIEPNGDPTFLQHEFREQKLFDLLKSTDKSICLILPEKSDIGRFGLGWSWGTWQQTYSPERSVMPIYGNMVRFYVDSNKIKAIPSYFDPAIQQPSGKLLEGHTSVLRSEHKNGFTIHKNSDGNRWVRPFTYQDDDSLAYILLRDTLKNINPNISLELVHKRPTGIEFRHFHTVPTDTLVRVMMKRSDNFFAEQILLMAGKVKFGEFNEAKIRKYVQEELLKDVWINGKWVDGSGLSRSNLISPNEFINLLQLIYKSEDIDRVKHILPAGNDGTLKGLYKGYENNIAAKTGTLTDHLALSGYLKTESGRNLAFSFLVNNHRGSANAFRNKIAEYLTRIIEKY